jgi:hypothetical protein
MRHVQVQYTKSHAHTPYTHTRARARTHTHTHTHTHTRTHNIPLIMHARTHVNMPFHSLACSTRTCIRIFSSSFTHKQRTHTSIHTTYIHIKRGAVHTQHDMHTPTSPKASVIYKHTHTHIHNTLASCASKGHAYVHMHIHPPHAYLPMHAHT